MATESESEAPAIKTLGSLFKLTRVHLWDDALFNALEVSPISEHHDILTEEHNSFDGSKANTSNADLTINDGYAPPLEDVEIFRQMNTLGLPTSFITSREKRTVSTKAKRKGRRKKSLSGTEATEAVSGVSKEGEGLSFYDVAEDGSRPELLSSEKVLLHTTARNLSENAQEQVHSKVTGVMESVSMDHDNVADGIVSKSNSEMALRQINLDAKNLLGSALQDASSRFDQKEADKELTGDKGTEGSSISHPKSDAGEKVCIYVRTEQAQISDSAESSLSSALPDHGIQDEFNYFKPCNDLDEWRAVWDAFYMRNYFYNCRTQESTWYPPPGMEHLAFSESVDKKGEMIADAVVEAAWILQEKNDLSLEVQTCDRLLGQSQMPEKVISGLAQSTVSDNFEQFHELEGKINSFEVKEGSDEDLYLVPSSSLSNIQDQLDVCEHLAIPVESITSQDTKEICDDTPLQVPLSDSSNSTPADVGSEESLRSGMLLACMSSTADELDDHYNTNVIKKKKKVRRTRLQQKVLPRDNKELSLQGVLEGFSADVLKYWHQRYLLFSRFDDGIKMDEEGWFSATPERIARHHASRLGNGCVIDCFTGVGGNAIHFAKRSNQVIAIDIDPQKIDYAQHNATIYGVADNIDFIKGDFFQIAPKLKGDAVFMSPPWGGPDYAKVEAYNIRTMLKPCDGFGPCSYPCVSGVLTALFKVDFSEFLTYARYLLFAIARGIASRIVMFLPRNVNLNQLAELSLLAHPPWALEVERNFLNGKLKAITAYFSDTSL